LIWIGWLIVAFGFVMHLAAHGSEEGETLRSTCRVVVIIGIMGSAPYLLMLGQEAANDVVGMIGEALPGLAVIPTQTIGGVTSLDYTGAFANIAKLLGEVTPAPADIQWWQIDKWSQLMSSASTLSMVGFLAAVAVVMMEGMLILQRILITISLPLLPIFIGCLVLPAAHSTGVHFIKNLIGVLCWPLAWSLGHVGTLALIEHSQPANIVELLPQLMFQGFVGLMGFLWVGLVTFLGPFLIHRMVTGGSNFYAGLMQGALMTAGGVAGAAGAVGGATGGAAVAGQAGAAVGAALGQTVAIPFQSMGEGLTGEHAAPSRHSAAIADAVIRQIQRGRV